VTGNFVVDSVKGVVDARCAHRYQSINQSISVTVSFTLLSERPETFLAARYIIF
jgi:hypothetical protein